MNETTCYKPVPLVLVGHGRWIENQVVQQFFIGKAQKGNNAGNGYDDNGKRYCCHAGKLISSYM
jgi:hypothetical protein